MNEVTRRYLREFGISTLLYVLTILGSVSLVQRMGPSVWRYLVALVPVAPVAGMVWSFLRYLDGIDEMQQRIHLLGLGFAAGATGMLTFSYGLLQNAGLPGIPMVWVLPLLMVTWGLGSALAQRRYR